MKILIIIQLLIMSLGSYAADKSVKVSQIRGMNFEYIVSNQGFVTLDPLYCEQCAIVLVKGEPNTSYSVSCDFVDVVKNSSRIEILDCLLAHDQRIVTTEIYTDIRGVAYLTVGSKINVKDKFSSGEYRGKIILNIRKNEKEGF